MAYTSFNEDWRGFAFEWEGKKYTGTGYGGPCAKSPSDGKFIQIIEAVDEDGNAHEFYYGTK